MKCFRESEMTTVLKSWNYLRPSSSYPLSARGTIVRDSSKLARQCWNSVIIHAFPNYHRCQHYPIFLWRKALQLPPSTPGLPKSGQSAALVMVTKPTSPHPQYGVDHPMHDRPPAYVSELIQPRSSACLSGSSHNRVSFWAERRGLRDSTCCTTFLQDQRRYKYLAVLHPFQTSNLPFRLKVECSCTSWTCSEIAQDCSGGLNSFLQKAPESLSRWRSGPPSKMTPLPPSAREASA